MIVLGITGGIGSGKSYVCENFLEKKFPVYYSDLKMKLMLNTSPALREEMMDMFGREIYTKEGKYNIEYVVEQVRKDPDYLDRVSIVCQSFFIADFRKFKKENFDKDIIGIESAILYKSKGLIKEIDKILLIDASESCRIERIKKRDPQRKDEDIKTLLKKQEAMKTIKWDYLILNEDNDDLEKDIQNVIDSLLK